MGKYKKNGNGIPHSEPGGGGEMCFEIMGDVDGEVMDYVAVRSQAIEDGARPL